MNNDFLLPLLNQKIFYLATPDDFKQFVAARAIAPTMCHMLPYPGTHKPPIHEVGLVQLTDFHSCKRVSEEAAWRRCVALAKLIHPKAVAVCFDSAIYPDLIHPGSPGEAWHPGPLPLALAESASVIDWECGTVNPLSLNP